MTPDTLNEVRVMHGLPPIDVAADAPTEANPKAEAKAAAQLVRGRLATLAGIMSVPDGRTWMAWLLTECRAFCASDFANNQLAMARNIGLRELAISLQADLHRACPGEYLTMLRERGTNERDNRDGAAVSGD